MRIALLWDRNADSDHQARPPMASAANAASRFQVVCSYDWIIKIPA
jgi:hypothetical protein